MTFRHVCENGHILTLEVDMDACPPKVKPTARIPEECRAEYRQWRDDVVVPLIYSCMTPDQASEMLARGLLIFREGKK